MDLELPLWFEIGSLVVLTLILIADLLLILKRPHIPSTRESTLWVVFYVSLALIFAGLMWIFAGPEYAGPVRRRLADRVQPVDRQPLRVRADHGQFAVPRRYQQEVLMVGIIIALILRGALHPASAPRSSSSSAGCSTSSAPSWSGRPGGRPSPAATTTTRCRRRTSSSGSLRRMIDISDHYDGAKLRTVVGRQEDLDADDHRLRRRSASPTCSSRSTRSRRSSASRRARSSSSRRTSSRSWVCASCTSCSATCSTACATCTTASRSSWPSSA